MNTNRTYVAGLSIARAFMLLTAAASFSHIIETSHRLGLVGWEAWTTPFLIDGFAALGMLGRSKQFAASTRRIGLWVAIASGLLSLVANVYAGHTIGQRIYGVLVVAVFVTAEWYADRMAPAPAAAVEVDAELAAKRSAAARKAAATRAANKAKAAKPARRRKPAHAPVSPGAPVTGRVLTDEELAAVLA